MAEFLVEWKIQVEADSHEDAARNAFAHMQRSGTTATVFHVYGESDNGEFETIDLTEIDERFVDEREPLDAWETAAINAGWTFRNCAFWHDETNMMFGPPIVVGEKPDWKALCAEHGIDTFDTSLTAAEALERIRARLNGDWYDPSGDLESDIKVTLNRIK